MDEYIKKDDVLKLLNRNSITKAIAFADGISIYDSVRKLPAADVAPKSEVALKVLDEIFDKLKLEFGQYSEDDFYYIERSLDRVEAELKKKYTEEKKQ